MYEAKLQNAEERLRLQGIRDSTSPLTITPSSSSSREEDRQEKVTHYTTQVPSRIDHVILLSTIIMTKNDLSQCIYID